jgi:glucosylceramidase
MKKLLFLLLIPVSAFAQMKINWIQTTQSNPWQTNKTIVNRANKSNSDVEVLVKKPLQTMDGFGTCFNELGWKSLSVLSTSDREKIMQDLFEPNKGANFTICRMPLGANDFSNAWYSYNETEGDFDMKKFSIENDKKTLIPFIKNAQKYNPKLQLWASPWSPPTWMKTNKHYACKPFPKGYSKQVYEELRNDWGMDFEGFDNGLQPNQERKEGTNTFIQEDKYFKAYSLYFSKFITAYRKEKIKIGMVMPQNEFNSAQVFPSCTWTVNGLANFLRFLAPEMHEQKVRIFFGTMERPNYKLVDSILTDKRINKYIRGVGFQWAGKDAISEIDKLYPNLKLYQSEQECGNGKNDWKYCNYTWSLMKHYIKNGANAYMYWNTSLFDGGISTWGWRQNSLISVDQEKKSFKYNHEYYVLKHLSHFVKPGAKLLQTQGSNTNLLAFKNKDNSIVVVIQNAETDSKVVVIKIGNKTISPVLNAESFNTFVIR